MPQRSGSRWDTTFGRWVSDVSVPRLVESLGAAGQPVTAFAVHKWIAGDRVPRHQRVEVIVELSCGRVTAADVYAQRTAAGRDSHDRRRC